MNEAMTFDVPVLLFSLPPVVVDGVDEPVDGCARGRRAGAACEVRPDNFPDTGGPPR
ncbi:MAG TPA: hypothetical protein VE987_21270 [Polyangiaceae bacterium]|nr:hypothetical protein [Polyangiaceae bacterium]